MPTFNRQPEWQQPADRHTQLVDPVLTVRQLSRFELSLKHVVRIDHALVFATPKGGYEAYLPPRRPTRGEIASHRYTAVYEVDMGVHPFTGTLTFPSDNDAFEFTADVDLSWQVLDPARFVASGHRDVPKLLLGTLQQVARPVTRRFAIADSAAAEEELLRTLLPLDPLGATAGLQVTWTLRVKRDQANIEHQQRLQSIDHSATEQIRVAQRGTEVDTEADRRYRHQDQLQLDRAMAYGRQHQELALQQQAWEHQLAIQRGQQLLEMQQLEAQKIAYYQWHLQQGGVQAWALHLAQHPEDTGLVMHTMREDQLRMVQAQMDLVKELLNGENAEKFELEGPKQLALRTVSDVLNQRLPGVQHNPPLLPQATGSEPGYGHPGAGEHQTAGAAMPVAPGQAPDGTTTAVGQSPGVHDSFPPDQQTPTDGVPGAPGPSAHRAPPTTGPNATATGLAPDGNGSYAPHQQSATNGSPGAPGPSAGPTSPTTGPNATATGLAPDGNGSYPAPQPPPGTFIGGPYPGGPYPSAPGTPYPPVTPTPTVPYAGPTGTPHPAPPGAGTPPYTPSPTPYAPPSAPGNPGTASAPGAPYSPYPGTFTPPPPTGAAPGTATAAGAPYSPHPGALTPPPSPSMPPSTSQAWQPPPGYGSTPTAPPTQHAAETPAPAIPGQQTAEYPAPNDTPAAPHTSDDAPVGPTASRDTPAAPHTSRDTPTGPTASADAPATSGTPKPPEADGR
ncbi:hypothetical protein [Streptomyces dysideae]|uniref:hypothetical protein n=1 Tax=Streptomyces dysideae TaxID=909626 RepID=UPI000A7BAEDB|nr:hypothetical protein [Streptomyces dysideae]